MKEFWIELDWGTLKGKDTKIKRGGPYPTRAWAEQMAINFTKIYGSSGSGASAKVIETEESND